MRVPWVPWLLLVGSLAVGCGSEDADSSSATPTALPSESKSQPLASDAPHTLSPEERAQRQAERRAKRAAEVAERCDPLLSQVTLTFEVTTEPTDRGTEIGLRMTLDNRSESLLSGDTGGEMRVAPGPRHHGIAWGGSSADTFVQGPGTVSARDVWHERQPPGWRPIGEQVTSFSFYAYTYAPGPGTVVCHIPATIIAPRGLVDGHRSGRWTQQPS